MRPPTGYATVRYDRDAVLTVQATPWANAAIDEATLAFMEAEASLARVPEATLSADGLHGPFRARIGEYSGVGATPLDAFREAVDQRRRAGW